MTDDTDAPIALRRTPRRSTGCTSAAGGAAPKPTVTMAPSQTQAQAQTPSRSRSKKRVRFSDPGPDIHHGSNSPSSTGLTPRMRRSSLGAAPSAKRRRFTTPSRMCGADGGDGEDELAGTGNASNEIRFFPLRQVLDDRVKRRIKRNGLSEEMNVITSERKRRVQRDREELQRLRDVLAEKDAEIDQLRETTLFQDAERIVQLEKEVEYLRSKLDSRPEIADQTQFDWTIAARDPFSDSCIDDEGFGDTTMGDVLCSTPSRARASFPTPPCTSPPLPATPVSVRRMPSTPSSHAGVQVCFPDPEKEALEAELGSLRLELTKLSDTIEDHENLRSHIADKLSAAPNPTSEDQLDLETHLDGVLQSLSDRTAALLDLNSSLSSLGFAGNDAGEIVVSLTNAFRSARLELEYLTPGELTLPLSSRGAEVLDLVLVRLRSLARRVKEDEESIDEYHALELSLRQQLTARVEAMDGINREVKKGRESLKEKNERIAELELGTDRLKGAIDGYRRDITELETLVQKVEEEGREREKSLQTDVEETKKDVETKTSSIAELEAKLASVLSQTAELRIQLADVQTKKVVDIAELNKTHGKALALRDARVGELRGEIDSINDSLRSAHETIRQLRVENLGLKGDMSAERKKAKEAVDSMKAELERVLRMSEGILATPKKAGEGSSRRRGSQRSVQKSTAAAASSGEAAEVTRKAKGKKRRKYDSGLGFLDEEEDDDIMCL